MIHTQSDFIRALSHIMRPVIAAMLWYELGAGQQTIVIGGVQLNINKRGEL